MPAADPAVAPSPRLVVEASVETVLLAASLFWAVAVNQRFFAGVVEGHRAGGIGLVAALGVGLVALHFLLLAPFATRRTVRPLLALVFVATACAAHYMNRFGVYLDPSMLRNVLRTDVGEARELLTPALLRDLALYAGLPLLALSRVTIAPRTGWLQAAGVRVGTVGIAAAALVGVVVAQYQPLASTMRNHPELRYLITPGNYVWSLAAVAGKDARASGPKTTIGADARPGPGWTADPRPRVVVLVVGETARAANWGLDGYARQTTPELATLPVVNFADVTSCGTNTEVSLPCMFSAQGRRHYDEAAIRGSESLLQVLARAGVGVRWRDNQSGCKGVCDGLPTETAASVAPAGTCPDGHCLDEALLAGLDDWLAGVHGRQLLVLHQLGNHGPAYFRRYPPAFERFTPACRDDDLRKCSREEIVNAYDNSLLYTDHLLATLVRTLAAHADRVDATLVYASDHGESLGESGLYLHGLPYAIAPSEQTQVPMLVWSGAGGVLDTGCLARRAAQPASHDNLVHLLLGQFDVGTALYEPALDPGHGCRRDAAS